MLKLHLALLILTLSANSVAADGKSVKVREFGSSFNVSENSQPDGFSKVPDPLDIENNTPVYKFSIVPMNCIGGDCPSESARASVTENVWDGRPKGKNGQPKEAWYSWEIYFPADFPYGSRQAPGFNQFAEWKDQSYCNLISFSNHTGWSDEYLSWNMKENVGDDCVERYEKRIVPMKSLLGGWHRFEVFVRWSRESDGKALVFVDGALKLDYDGNTCFEDCMKFNYFLFGNYLCCTSITSSIVPSTVYYRNVSRAKSRERLAGHVD